MTRSTAERRHESSRLKEKRKDYAAVKAGTPKPCSCFMCGNPRKWFGEKSIQERRFYQDV